jgi:hypothetical protein
MLIQHIKYLSVGKQLKAALVRVAAQAYLIVISDCFMEVLMISCIDLISMRIMTHPAGEFFIMFL